MALKLKYQVGTKGLICISRSIQGRSFGNNGSIAAGLADNYDIDFTHVNLTAAGIHRMIFGQIEKEGLELDLGMYGCPNYWDAVYSVEEEDWESGEEIQHEIFDTFKVENQVSESQPLP